MLQIKRALSWTAALLTIVACSLWLAYLGSRPGYNGGAQAFSRFSTLVLLLVVGFIPSYASALATHHPKRAGCWLLGCAVVLGLWLAVCRVVHAGYPREFLETSVQNARLETGYVVLTFSFLILPSLFWFVGDRCNWLPVSPAGGLGLRYGCAAIVLTVIVLSVAATVMDLHIHDWAECHSSVPPFARQQFPEQAVFNGRVLETGLLWPSRLDVEQQPGALRKYWAMAVVEKHFWGLPWWDHGIVLLTLLQRGTGDSFQRGESYFIDGRRRSGSLTQFLPVFETFCSRTARLTNAEVDLRVLRDGNPKEGVRIIGHTIHVASDNREESMPQSRVAIDGPAGRVLTMSDQDGVYDVSGLPPGEYEVGTQADEGQGVLRNPDCILRGVDQPTKSGDIRECDVSIR